MKALFKKGKICFLVIILLLSVVVPVSATIEDSSQYRVTKVKGEISTYGTHYFHYGLMPVMKVDSVYEDGYPETRWAYLNRDGEIVNLSEYDYGFEFSEGLAAVYGNGLGYMDTSGNIVIPMNFQASESHGVVSAGRFVNGHAHVFEATGINQWGGTEGQWYTINTAGEKVDMEIDYDTIISDVVGYVSEGNQPETITILGETIEGVVFSEGLALVHIYEGPHTGYYVVEKTGEEPNLYTNLSNLSFTSWQSWDNGSTLNYKLTNPTNQVDHGAYAVIICGSGYDTTEDILEDSTTSRFENSDYYPIEGHIFEYTAQPGETINHYLFSRMGGEQDVAEEDLGKGSLRYIVVKLKSETEKAELQADFDDIGLELYKFHTREENRVLQNWLRENFGLTKGGNNYEKFN